MFFETAGNNSFAIFMMLLPEFSIIRNIKIQTNYAFEWNILSPLFLFFLFIYFTAKLLLKAITLKNTRDFYGRYPETG